MPAPAQRLVYADSIVMVRNSPPDTTVGYVFPRSAALDYRHLRLQLIPAYEQAVDGLQTEVGALRSRVALQDSLAGLLRQNEADLRRVTVKQDTVIRELRMEWGEERASKRRWRSVAIFGVPLSLLLGFVAGAVAG